MSSFCLIPRFARAGWVLLSRRFGTRGSESPIERVVKGRRAWCRRVRVLSGGGWTK